MKRLPALLLLLCLSLPAAARKQAACPYAAWKSGFKGDARAQATCLLRPVKLYARLGESAPLPDFLAARIGQRTGMARPACAAGWPGKASPRRTWAEPSILPCRAP